MAATTTRTLAKVKPSAREGIFFFGGCEAGVRGGNRVNVKSPPWTIWQDEMAIPIGICTGRMPDVKLRVSSTSPLCEKIPLPLSQAGWRSLAGPCCAQAVHPQAPFRGRCGPDAQAPPCANPVLPLKGRGTGCRPDGAQGGIRHLGLDPGGLSACFSRTSHPAPRLFGNRSPHGPAEVPEGIRPGALGGGSNPP